MKKIYVASIRAYQYISKMLPSSCRYYPTCSEYAKWQFELNRADRAFVASGLRILRCNQFFAGGIDYPIINWNPPKLFCLNRDLIKIKYWLIPKKNQKFIVIKSFD
jgi:putative membrane protein insertion efficiency factor